MECGIVDIISLIFRFLGLLRHYAAIEVQPNFKSIKNNFPSFRPRV